MINLNPANLANPTAVDQPVMSEDWSVDAARIIAYHEGLELTAEHWQVVGALQKYYARHQDAEINIRDLHDALEERFHSIGGMKQLYKLFPGGPVAQGCRVAGLVAPAGAVNLSFGSVQ